MSSSSRMLIASRPNTLALSAFALAVLMSPVNVSAQKGPPPANDFVLLLAGIYEPVAKGPNLGLQLADLRKGTYSRTKIYHVSGLPIGDSDAIGNFYFNDYDMTTCVYQLPGGAMTALIETIDAEIIETDGGWLFVGTAELPIAEGTGIYRSFEGGSIFMIFSAFFTETYFDENCLCFISRP